jgi:hypothetical protein
MSTDTDSTNMMPHEVDINVADDIEAVIAGQAGNADDVNPKKPDPPQEIVIVAIGSGVVAVNRERRLPTNFILLAVLVVCTGLAVIIIAVFFDGAGDAHKETLVPTTPSPTTELSSAPTMTPATAEPSSAPTSALTRHPNSSAPSSAPTTSAAPSASPTDTTTAAAFSPQQELEFCGTNFETVIMGLGQTSEVLKRARLSVGLPAIQPSGEAFTLPGIFMGHQFLVQGTHKFVDDFIGPNGRMHEQSPAVIASMATNWIFEKHGLPNESLQSLLTSFEEVNVELKGIGKRLAGNSNPFFDAGGFEFGQIEGSVVGGSLTALTSRYAKFVHPGDQSLAHRQHNAFSFHDACLYQYNPLNAFQAIYAHACDDCEYFKGQALMPLLDQYVDLANRSFPNDVAARIVWFQQEFSAPVMKAMLDAMYLSSACLFSPFPTCFDADLQWVQDMEEMGDAIKKVAKSLAKAENRLGCSQLQAIFSYPCF